MRKRKVVGPMDLTSDIIAFESGELDEAATLQLFQNLVNTGLAWQLQGSYGRTAAALLEAGLITRIHGGARRGNAARSEVTS